MGQIKIPNYYLKEIKRIIELSDSLSNALSEDPSMETSFEWPDTLNVMLVREIAKLRDAIKELNAKLENLKEYKPAVVLTGEEEIKVEENEASSIIRDVKWN